MAGQYDFTYSVGFIGDTKDLTNKIRRQGGHVEVRHRNDQGALLVVWKKDKEVEEIIIQSVS